MTSVLQFTIKVFMIPPFSTIWLIVFMIFLKVVGWMNQAGFQINARSVIGRNLIGWKRYLVHIKLKTFKELIDIIRDRDHTLDAVEDFPYAVMESFAGLDANVTNMTQVVLTSHKLSGAKELLSALESNLRTCREWKKFFYPNISFDYITMKFKEPISNLDDIFQEQNDLFFILNETFQETLPLLNITINQTAWFDADRWEAKFFIDANFKYSY